MALEIRHVLRCLAQRAAHAERHHALVFRDRRVVLIPRVAAEYLVGTFARKHNRNLLSSHLRQEPQRHARQIRLRLVHVVLNLGQGFEKLVRRNHLAVVLDAQLVGKLLGVIGFVELVVIETNRERFVGHEACGDVARIDAARKEAAHLHVGDAVRAHAFMHHFIELVDVFLERLVDFREIAIPIAAHIHRVGGQVVSEAMRGRQLVHALEERFVGRGELQREIRTQRIVVHGLVELRVREEALDLAAEHQAAAIFGLGVIKRLDAENIASAEQAILLLIPDNERIHATKLVDDFLAPLLVAMQKRLGVGAAVEGIALRLELAAKLHEVVDFAVEHDDDAAVFVAHGLGARRRKVENRQAAEAQRHARREERIAHVGTAVDDAVHHAREHLLLVFDITGKSDESAHRAPFVCMAQH